MIEEKKEETISFRVTSKEYSEIQRVARILFSNEKLKSDTAGALARACTIVQVNQFIQLELMQKAVDDKEKKIEELKQNVQT